MHSVMPYPTDLITQNKSLGLHWKRFCMMGILVFHFLTHFNQMSHFYTPWKRDIGLKWVNRPMTSLELGSTVFSILLESRKFSIKSLKRDVRFKIFDQRGSLQNGLVTLENRKADSIIETLAINCAGPKY